MVVISDVDGHKTKGNVFPDFIWFLFLESQHECPSVLVGRILPHWLDSFPKQVEVSVVLVLGGSLAMLIDPPECLDWVNARDLDEGLIEILFGGLVLIPELYLGA